MPRKNNTKSQRNKNDKLWGSLIHQLFPVCAVRLAGAQSRYGACSGHVEAHHLVTRRRGSSRHSVENGIGLCSSHHNWNPDCSAHAGPLGFLDFLKECRVEQYNWLRTNHNKHVAVYDYVEQHEELTRIKEELDSLEQSEEGTILWTYKGIPYRIPSYSRQ